jgi:hypothetical protein
VKIGTPFGEFPFVYRRIERREDGVAIVGTVAGVDSRVVFDKDDASAARSRSLFRSPRWPRWRSPVAAATEAGVRRSSFASGGDGLQLGERVAEELAQVLAVRVRRPAFEGDAEDRHPGVGGEARGGIGDAAFA